MRFCMADFARVSASEHLVDRSSCRGMLHLLRRPGSRSRASSDCKPERRHSKSVPGIGSPAAPGFLVFLICASCRNGFHAEPRACDCSGWRKPSRSRGYPARTRIGQSLSWTPRQYSMGWRVRDQERYPQGFFCGGPHFSSGGIGPRGCDPDPARYSGAPPTGACKGIDIV